MRYRRTNFIPFPEYKRKQEAALEIQAAALKNPAAFGRMPNKYAGTCPICNEQVPAGAGFTGRDGRRWIVLHPQCKEKYFGGLL